MRAPSRRGSSADKAELVQHDREQERQERDAEIQNSGLGQFEPIRPRAVDALRAPPIRAASFEARWASKAC
jgi:hypothetical protein